MAKAKPLTRARKRVAKWRTLKHNGPQFQPPYKRLGKGLHLFKYKNKVQPLTAASEEVVVMFAKYLLRTNKSSRNVGGTVKKNFFSDWRESYMSSAEFRVITNFNDCNFDGVVKHLKRLGETKKAKSKAEKEREKRLKEQNMKKFKYVTIDGKLQLVSNPMVEPSGLFIGRGDNKNMGRIKDRIEPEDVVINCSDNWAPRPPVKRRWKAVVHDHSKIWLASYEDSITGKTKYIFPHPSSVIKSKSEQEKYDKAEELTEEIARIRRKYQKDLQSEDETTCQLATALYFLDNLALRVGNEKNAGETDTVGCCTLRKEHIKLIKPNKIRLNFFGKDSVPYEREETVLPVVFQNLEDFLEEKSKKELIFDQISSKSLNDYLSEMKDELTAKVFRTFKATAKYKESIRAYTRGLTQDDDIRQIKLAHLKANLDVAKLLNHVTMTRNVRKTNGKGRQTINRNMEKVKKLRKEYKRLENKRLKKTSEEYEGREDLKTEIEILEAETKMKNERKKWALTTSLINYIDPRVVKEFLCDKLNLNPRHVYSKAQLDRFQWAFKGKQKRKIAVPSKSRSQPQRNLDVDTVKHRPGVAAGLLEPE